MGTYWKLCRLLKCQTHTHNMKQKTPIGQNTPVNRVASGAPIVKTPVLAVKHMAKELAN